jgi:transcriptional regulator with XRE-family HTH domain
LRGISQAALADQAGLKGNSVALIERGQRGVSMETLNALASVLDVPAACLAMLGTSNIAGDGDSTSLVKSLQKLIVATIVAQVRIETKEEAENAKQNQIQKAMRSIPDIESLLNKLAGKRKTARRGKSKIAKK